MPDTCTTLFPTIQRLSDIRTTNLHPSTPISAMNSSASWPPSQPTVKHKETAIKNSTQECTDACVVIPCVEATHNTTRGHAECGLESLDESTCIDCTGFEEFLQCCTDYHSYLTEPKYKQNDSSIVPWESSFDSYMCGCGEQNPQTSQQPVTANNPAAESQILHCMWGNCTFECATLNDLVGHVNLDHLRAPSQPAVAEAAAISYPVFPEQDQQSMSALACMWRDCTEFPSPERIPGPSSGNKEDAALDFLHAHLLQDHLGLPARPNSPVHNWNQDNNKQASTSTQPGIQLDTTAITPAASPPPHECAGSHVCHWEQCGQSYTSCDDLTAHITAMHVGAGKTHYECFWQNCNRNGDRGFTSKQKICRHLQSHTGHRPFQCTMCKQNFSEAATLQQHMRRHTQEKPYACDYPGCGKAFAITGALTIHKRTHNGDKPFKCSYCDRAFAESSNLSKHLRTHTGAKPHVCKEPGCGKAFARPDQLTRHMGVHNKVVKS